MVVPRSLAELISATNSLAKARDVEKGLFSFGFVLDVRFQARRVLRGYAGGFAGDEIFVRFCSVIAGTQPALGVAFLESVRPMRATSTFDGKRTKSRLK